jgi:hypothetical protein
MAECGVRYYILFANHEQGLALHDLLKASGIKNRIAPAPRSVRESHACGMSLLIEPDQLEAVRHCIDQNRAAYLDIVPVADQFQPHRDKYC